MAIDRFLKPDEVDDFRDFFIDSSAEMRLEGDNLVISVDWRRDDKSLDQPPEVQDVAQVPLQDVILHSAYRAINLNLESEDQKRNALFAIAGRLREMASHVELMAKAQTLRSWEDYDPKFDVIDDGLNVDHDEIDREVFDDHVTESEWDEN